MGTYQQLFAALPEEALATDTMDRLLAAAARKRAAARRMRLWAGLAGSLVSVAGFVVAVPLLVAGASASGFSLLASLALTDSDVAFAHAGTFLVSLVETLPGLDTALVLVFVAVLLASLRGLVRALPRAHHARPALA